MDIKKFKEEEVAKMPENGFKGDKNVVIFLDEISINGITGETFTNGENN